MSLELLLEVSFLFVFSFINLFFFRNLAKRMGLVDRPNARKRHQDEVPLIGGLSITFSLLYFIFNNQEIVSHPFIYAVSITLLVVMGVLDDKYELSIKVRLCGQAALSIVMITIAGLEMHFLGDMFGIGPVHLGLWGGVITIMAVIGAINAFNMVDGIDGLLGGLSIVSFSALAIIFALAGVPQAAIFSLALVVCMLPYIIMNLGILGRGKKVFMGDAGSMMIGFTVIWLILSGTQEGQALMRPVTALWIIAVPLMDMTAIMYRRIRRGGSPFKPDRDHIHHLFQRLGYTSRQTLIMICGLASVFAGVGILGEVYMWPEYFMFATFITTFLFYAYLLNHMGAMSTKIEEHHLTQSENTANETSQ